MWWVSAILFFVLSPGVLLTLPAGSRGVFMSRQTSVLAAAVHAVVFAVASHFLWQYYKEEFKNKEVSKKGRMMKASGRSHGRKDEGNVQAVSYVVSASPARELY